MVFFSNQVSEKMLTWQAIFSFIIIIWTLFPIQRIWLHQIDDTWYIRLMIHDAWYITHDTPHLIYLISGFGKPSLKFVTKGYNRKAFFLPRLQFLYIYQIPIVFECLCHRKPSTSHYFIKHQIKLDLSKFNHIKPHKTITFK